MFLTCAPIACGVGAPEVDASRSPEQIRATAEAADTARLEGIIRDYELSIAVLDDWVELAEYVRLSRNLEIYRAELARRD